LPGAADAAPPAEAPAAESASPVPAARPNAQLSRSQILDATEQCLIRKGYDGTTIRGIASILGCAVGSIYRYFSDKRQLLDAVTQRRFRPVLEHVRARQKPHRTAMLYLQVAADQPQLYRMMFWLPGIADQQNPAAVPTIVRQIIDGWATQLGSEDAAETFWCRLHGSLILGKNPTALIDSLSPDAAAPLRTPASPEPVATRAEDVTLL
jgi:AcrR family transcriptional regulator